MVIRTWLRYELASDGTHILECIDDGCPVHHIRQIGWLWI